MNRLDGKVALISGAARGIGAETARRMVGVGAKVVLGDVLDEAGRKVARELEAAGGQAVHVHLDVTQEADWNQAVAAAVSRFGGLDILVNNAGVLLGKTCEESTLAEWNWICGVNLTGVFLGTKLALPALKERAKASPHGGSVVNVSSTAGLVGSPLAPLYSLTKGGVTMFSKSTALEFARKGYRIRVNSIHPGVIETDMGEETFRTRARYAGSNDLDAARKQGLATHPIGRFGTAGDIANGIVFLASDDAAFMTGSSLVVDGGVTAQ
jgi:3(or 17)beta-hydroxysteroid dehydrogenase